MGYLDTRQKIIDTLTGRAVGAQIQPINHQEFALALLDYIRQVELITASTLVGTAERGTVPVQSDKANLAYVAACPVGETVVFENFHGQDGQPLQYTADVNSAAIIILTWNKEYWIITAVPASVLVTADNVNYTTSIRKTYANKASMEADTNPVDEKNIPITNGQLVSVVNNSDSTYNGIYAREGTGWTFQSGFNFGLVQTTGQNVNHAMSQKATTDALNAVEEKADTATRILPFDGVVRNPTIEMQGIIDYDSIVFDEVRGLFLANKVFKYYNAFPGAEHYNKNMKARTDRLYLRTDTQLVYICDGASLQPFILSESDKAKMGSYPAQFVMDFGLVESQAAGEQMAAASEVAGNRNISFIRFQVKGVSTLKTNLIMQWPNGVNETAQIMCIDKAQWRRNVTGATGVEGDPTNAYPWERTAPHYIFYDAARRIIQLQDYEKREVKKVELPLATTTQPGLMSAEDKTKLSKTKPVEEVTWTAQSHMNAYTECGEFHIKGERTNENDGLPILNAASGHTIDATLTVLDSSLTNGTGEKTDVCVTHILRLSNRTGGDGHIFIRTGQATTKSQLASAHSTYWGPWEKLVGIFEKNGITSVDELDACTTNGMYSGIFASTNRTALGGIQFYPGDTFLMITANGYAATPFGTPQLTQILFKFPVRNAPLPTAANMYLRVAHWDADNKKWVFENFKRMATNDELSSQVATLTAKINQNAANIASANEAASEAITTAQEAQAAANSASENAAQAQELATQAKTDAARAQGTATNALSEAIEAKSNAATAFSAANNAQNTADAAQEKNTEQDERLVRIENNVSHLFIAGRYWDEDNSTPTAAGHYGSLEALRYLPERLGLGRYLVTDDRKRKKLDPKDSTKYLDGSPAALDGSEGQCMWCWNGFYANIWHDGSRLIKAVTFDKPIGGETSIWIPAGGISWLGAGVMDRTENKLCSIISDPALYGHEFDAERYRGGAGVALDTNKYTIPQADSPQITMLGMPATYVSTNDFGKYARKRGEGWEANWFVARFVVEFLFEVIMGTEDSQEAFNANKDANGLYQGGFGIGLTDMPGWGGYNKYLPIIPTSVGLEAGDGVCLVPYSLMKTDGVYHKFNVPVFFGLVGAGFGHLSQSVRGLIMDAGEEKSLVYVTPSMYADYDPNTVADKILVAECPRVSGYIKRKSYQGLCCMPTEVGGTATIRFCDRFYTNVNTQKVLRVRTAGGNAQNAAYAGASCTDTFSDATLENEALSAPLCYFEEDPIIPESEKIEL